MRLNIAIAANFIAEPLEESLLVWFNILNMRANITFAPYNQLFQQLLDSSSLLSQNLHGLNILLIQFQASLNHSQPDYHTLIQGIKLASQKCDYLVCLCPPSPEDQPLEDYLAWENLIAQELNLTPGITIITYKLQKANYPVSKYFNSSGAAIGCICYTKEYYTATSSAIARTIHALKISPYKVIVVDCDQTLWNGICAEVGPMGVTIEPHHQSLQRMLIEQYHQGMLICLCSKNQEQDVLAVFKQNPQMLLSLEHILSWRINWQPKSENLKSLAVELNLTLDSFIFIDDNPLECAEVSAHSEFVLVLQLPQPSIISRFLQHLWPLDPKNTTQEDKQRTKLYRENLQRDNLQKNSLSLIEFINSLDLQLNITPILPPQLERVSELTKRTNQFNLTTIRRSKREIISLSESPSWCCLGVEVSDRFGDYGLVGCIFYQLTPNSLTIDTFLLSCRVLGRGVEHKMLAYLGAIAQSLNLPHIDLKYLPTPKNQPIFDFLNNISLEKPNFLSCHPAALGTPKGAGSEGSHQIENAKEDFLKIPLPEGILFRFAAGEIINLTYQPIPTQPTEIFLSSPNLSNYNRPKIDYYRIAVELVEVEAIMKAIAHSQVTKPRPAIATAYVAARSPLEQILTEIVQTILSLKPIGIFDNFFELGCNSLQAALFLNQISEKLQEIIYIVALIDCPTIETLALYLTQNYPEAVNRLLGKDCLMSNIPSQKINEIKLKTFQEKLPQKQSYQPLIDQKNPKAIFILSAPRSGSTLLRVMLAGHPALFVPPELHLLGFNNMQQRKKKLETFWSEGVIEAIAYSHNWDLPQASNFLKACEEQAMSIPAFYQLLQNQLKDKILVDKTPLYALDINSLKSAELYFDHPIYIHLIRHPYGMINSFEKAKLDLVLRYNYNYTRREIAEMTWLTCQENIQNFLQEIPRDRQHRLSYEDLVKNPNQSLAQLCEFLGIELKEEMLKPYSNSKEKMTQGLSQQSRMLGDLKFYQYQNIEATNADKWQKEYQEDFLSDLSWEQAARLGYDEKVNSKDISSFSPLIALKTAKESSHPPLFLIHSITGNILSYRDLAANLETNQSVIGLQAFGIDNHTKPLDDLSVMATKYLQAIKSIQPHGPYYIAGWSFGGVVAYEIAQQLLKIGDRTALVLLIDTLAPHYFRHFSFNDILNKFTNNLERFAGKKFPPLYKNCDNLPPPEKLYLIWQQAKKAEIIPQNMPYRKFRQLWLVMSANFHCLQTYQPQTYPENIILLRAEEETKNTAIDGGWQQLAPKLQTELIKGDHYSIMKPPYLQTLATKIDFYLNV